MKKLTAIVLTAVLCVLCAGCGAPQQQAEVLDETTTDETLNQDQVDTLDTDFQYSGMTVRYPSNWEVRGSGENGSLVVDIYDIGHLYIYANEPNEGNFITGSSTREDIQSWFSSYLTEFIAESGYTIFSGAGYSTKGNLVYQTRNFSYWIDDIKHSGLLYIAVNGDRVYRAEILVMEDRYHEYDEIMQRVIYGITVS